MNSAEAHDQDVPSHKDHAVARKISSGQKLKNESLLADIREELEHEQEIEEQIHGK